MNDNKPITEQAFRDAVVGVLLKQTPYRPKRENRQPTKRELHRRYRLQRRE